MGHRHLQNIVRNWFSSSSMCLQWKGTSQGCASSHWHPPWHNKPPFKEERTVQGHVEGKAPPNQHSKDWLDWTSLHLSHSWSEISSYHVILHAKDTDWSLQRCNKHSRTWTFTSHNILANQRSHCITLQKGEKQLSMCHLLWHKATCHSTCFTHSKIMGHRHLQNIVRNWFSSSSMCLQWKGTSQGCASSHWHPGGSMRTPRSTKKIRLVAGVEATFNSTILSIVSRFQYWYHSILFGLTA